ncbi:MAG TPA: selenium-dependent molybdenum cofactor biosynthesis protein YqeB [Anaerolineales bacterium]
MNTLVLLRGGGYLASGVALRLHRAGIRVVITELAEPLAVRRAVSLGEAVYEGVHTVEGLTARRVEPQQIEAVVEAGEIPVLIDPDAEVLLASPRFPVVIDARLLKTTPAPLPIDIPLHIGVGPGFHAGRNCHAVIETRRSHTLGRVYWDGATQPDSGQPEGDPRRVLRAPEDGLFIGKKRIGEHCESGEPIAEIQSSTTKRRSEIVSPLKGVLRGLIRDGIHVNKGLKVGDVDPRDNPQACYLVSDKALSIGGAALEAILTKVDIRRMLYQ